MDKRTRAFAKWTQEEINFLKENYFELSPGNLAKALNRNYGGPIRKAFELKLYAKATQVMQPQSNLTETEKAYIAAFIDAEGTIGFSIDFRGKKKEPVKVLPRLSITSRNNKVIEWIADKVNYGRWKSKKIYTRLRKNETTRTQWHRTYTLYLSNRLRLEPFLKAILPYLRIKSQLAILVLKFYQLHSPRIKPYSLEEWKIVLKSKELIDSYSLPHIHSRQRLAQFIKGLESKDQQDT